MLGGGFTWLQLAINAIQEDKRSDEPPKPSKVTVGEVVVSLLALGLIALFVVAVLWAGK